MSSLHEPLLASSMVQVHHVETYVRSVTLALIASPNYPGNIDFTGLLKSHFATPRVVALNDTISISAEEDLAYMNQVGDLDRLSWPIVHFKVMNIEGNGRLIDANNSKLYLTGSAKSHIPECKSSSIERRRRPTTTESPVLAIPRLLRSLNDIVEPYASGQICEHVHPIILISGSPGSGKRALTKAVAKKLSLHLYQVDANLILMDTPAATEAKLKIELGKIPVYAPCIVLVSNIEVICRDTSGNEARIAKAISDSLDEASKMSHPWPVITIFTTNNQHDVFSNIDLGALFLHHYHVQTLSEKERICVLNYFSQDFDERVNVRQLARKCAGFVLGDFYNLISSTKAAAFIESSAEKSSGKIGSISPVSRKLNHAELNAGLDAMLKTQARAAGSPQIPEVKWEDIGGLLEAKREILDTVQLPLEHPELLNCGLKRSGLLLYGPPGTGKTLLAKAVATECSLNFMSVKGPELINMYVGQSEQNVREVFSRAREALPCVIFFDELDSLAPNRGHSSESGGVMDRVVSQLLVEMDGINKTNQLFIIGATNRPDLLDPALLRPGRFDRLVYVGIADEPESRIKVLRALTRKFNLHHDLDLVQLELICPRFLTGADFYALCSSAMMKAVSRSIDLIEEGNIQENSVENFTLTADDFSAAIDSFVPSVSIDELMRYQRIKETISS